MHQMASANLAMSHRWWVLAIVVAAQFMFGVDAFVVNVAIPTIAVELHASTGGDRIRHRDLSDRLCDADRDRRPAWRHLRHQGRVSRGRIRLHADLAVVRPGAIRARADRRAAGAGRDRGADGAAGAGHAASLVRRSCAEPRLRHLWHRARARRSGRLRARRHAGEPRSRRCRLACRVLCQRPVRLRHSGGGREDHAIGPAPGRHAARCSRRRRAVSGPVVPDRAAVVRPRFRIGRRWYGSP